MPKAGEIEYLRQLGADGTRHALGKPFSDFDCGRYLVEMGTIMLLLPPRPARILDLGVGSGWTSVLLGQHGYSVVGQDIAPEMIELAEQNRARYETPTVSFVVQDYESMSFRDEFDAAIFYDALHHAEDEKAALAGAYAALKPGGICIASEPGEGHAVSEGAQHAVRSFGVTEKDMPPHHIIAIARQVGFRDFRVYLRPQKPVPVAAESPFVFVAPRRLRRKLARRYFRKAVAALRRPVHLFDPEHLGSRAQLDAPVVPIDPSSAAMEPVLRNGNFVWMRK